MLLASPYTKIFWNEFILSPHSCEYNLVLDQEIEGDLEVDRLRLAIAELAKDYILFNQVLDERDGQLQWVRGETSCSLEVLDPACDIASLVRDPFDLRQGPLCRFYLIQLSEKRFNFIVVVHHVLLDGLSGKEFYDAISHYYAGGFQPDSPTHEIDSLVDLYAGYEEDVTQLKDTFDSVGFWRGLLSEQARRVDLPYMPSREQWRTEFGEVRFSLSTSQWRTIKSGVKYATPFLLFKTIWAIVVARHSGLQKVCVGYPVAAESGQKLYYGAQVNMAVFPLSLEPDSTFSSVYSSTLNYTKNLKVSGQLRHSKLPVYYVLGEGPVRELNVNFAQGFLKDQPLVFEGCETRVNHRFNNDLAGSELLLEYQRSERGFEFRIKYKAHLFNDVQMFELAEQYQTLLQLALTDPERPLSTLPYLSAQQEQRLNAQHLSGDDGAGEWEATLFAGFERNARRFPTRTAVIDTQGAYSYEALSNRSTQLAQRLREEYLRIQGEEMPADTLIPLYVQRGASSVVAMLAILKAGAAYVPLDPYAPAQRLAYILNDVNSPIVLTETALKGAVLGILADSHCVLIDLEEEHPSEQPFVPLPEVRSEQLAYVIYTSGTTGKPKGTLCEHRGAANMIAGHTRRLLSHEQDVLNCLQFATLAFDAHVYEVFIALSNGHRLFIASEPQRFDLELLIGQMKEWQINFCFLPPALLSTCPSFPDSLRYIAMGGESTPQDVQDHYLAAGLQVANMYGPTEASVSVSINLYQYNGARNIGLSIANMRCYVVDEHFNLLPLGVEGELCLSGIGLARGYLNQPELTASAFIENPFSKELNYRRLYRTGDRVKRLADGSLEYCGRADQQVKINGFRIELGEIEAVIRAVPGVVDALVSVRKEPSPHLVAWCVLDPNRDLTTEQLYRQMSLQLPPHMLPVAMKAIASVPLTVSRKVDYRALPEPDLINQRVAFREPDTALESELLVLFNQMLGSHAGVDDDFFRLGGSSILAIRLCHELYKRFGIKVSALALSQYPTVALLSQYIVQQKMEQAQAPQGTTIRLSGRREALLSVQQSRLWFMENLSVGATHYLSPVLLQLCSDADCDTYIKSVQAVVARHQVLRSLIRQDEKGEAYQWVTEHVLEVPVLSMTEPQFMADLQAQLQQPFDLKNELPVRATVYCYKNEAGADVTASLLVFHHIAFDGWSMEVLIKELAALYDYYQGRAEHPPAPLGAQYIDYAMWQREQPEDESKVEALAFWRDALEGHQSLDIASDYSRPTVFDARGSNCEVVLSAALVTSLDALARQEGVTLHAVLLAGFTLLLARYTGEDDILVGTPLSNRSEAELESLIGFFVNTLPLRNQVPAECSVCAFIRQVAANTLQVQQHQSLPLEQLIESLGVQRDFSRHPLFQVMFALESDVSADHPNWFSVRDLSGYEDTAKFDLTLMIRPDAGQILARFNFATALFKEESISRLAGYFVAVLQQMVQNPGQRLKDVSLSPQQVLSAPYEQPFEYAFERTLQHDFTQYARQHPQAVAVIDELGEMTYGELYLAARTLSTQLQLSGNVTGEAIAILADKGRQQPIAMLAVLMCGKAFLPMDKGWPLQRRIGVMAQASINTLLSDEPWLTSDINVIELTTTGQALGLEQPVRLLSAVRVAPDSLAYIIFTSGSTGMPKGVAIEHRSVVNMIEGTRRFFAFDERDRSLALSALSFDLAIFDIFSPLSVGGAVVMPSERDRVNPQVWYQLIMTHRVTMWLSAPALLELLLDYIGSAGFVSGPVPALRAVMVGGDWIATSLPERFRQWAPDSCFCSVGGATEGAIFSVIYEVPQEKVLSVSIPYGKPLPHERFYILDAWLRPLPIGAKGEMYIAGEGLARCYYADEQRTADSFFWHEQLQTRVYRTGDVGRFLFDGNLEFMGRIDQQVKINGYRIELGEIENTVLSYPEVTACCVVLIQHAQPYLAAYLVASRPLEIEALRQYLCGELPRYMLPKACIQLDSMPLTENGKIDRKALPLPKTEQCTLVEAQGDLEHRCSAIWCELLKQERISVEDNFFSLGGNSILAIQACYQLSRQLRRDVTLSELGQYPTIRALCHYLSLNDDPCEVLVIPALHREVGPLSFSQQQLWFIEHLNGGSNLYHVPMLFQLSRDINLPAYCWSLKTIVERHHVLRSVISQQHTTTTSQLTDLALQVHTLQCEAQSWQQQLLSDIDRPFKMDREIPIRALLYEVAQADGSTVFYSLIVVHHLAFDGWSQNLFMQELVDLYDAYQPGYAPALPAPALQYSDYAIWQHEYLGSPYVPELRAFWKQQLQGWQMLEMPLDFVRPAQFDHGGANHSIVLPESLVASVADFVQREGVTQFALYLSAFNLLLSFFSGQQDILVGTPVANRPTAETRSVIGFFVNTLPLRSQINDELSLCDYVHEVFNASLQVQKYQGLPLEQLIDVLQVPRDLSRHPLFQVLFALEDAGQNATLPDWLQPQSLIEYYQAAKFDLTLSLHSQGECVQAVFNYASALFSPQTMVCLSQYYLTIVEHIVGQGSLRINQLALVPGAEIVRQREAWQSSPPAYDFERPIHADFIRQVNQQPQAIAIIDNLGELSYGGLYLAALTLSLQLREHVDMNAETIAVMVDKGRAQIISVLAIVMSGKAYLPLDGSWPEGRRQEILEQSRTRVVISSRSWHEEPQARLLLIDPYGSVPSLPSAKPGEPVFPEAGDLAYVIFTSGSTGAPKGVAIEHRGAVNTIVDTLVQLGLNAQDRGLTLSALSFDISAFDIFGLLSAGGTLVMPSETERYQPNAWHRLMATHGVTFWNSAPSVMALLMEYLDSDQVGEESLATLRTAVLVGEVIAKQLPVRIRQHSRDCRIVSAGGATESSIWSILYDIPDAPIMTPSVPYGKAMEHQRFYVLDSHMRLLPPCLPGEQYIGGAGVARGYFHDESVTRERFIYHPQLGERLYRTGDAGRYLPDGNLEFMGRLDFQVKINGYRVELGEVEAQALAFDPIKSCCVLVCKDAMQERLALYYVCDEPLVESQLLEFLSQQLPLYMIPTALIRLSALPYNSSGKVDRKALPAPGQSEQKLYVAPSTELEQQLCTLWQDTLKCQQVAMTDDFFMLGGTSIMAISVCMKLSQLLKTSVPVIKLFQCRTLEKLLALSENSLVIPLNSAQDGAPVLWMIHPALVGAEVFYPVAEVLEGSINCYGVDNFNLYHQPSISSLGALADRYLDEMIANGLQMVGAPVHILGWSLGGLIALEIAARLEQRGVTSVSLYLLDTFYQQTTAQASLAELLPALGITGAAADRAQKIAPVEDQLSCGELSLTLKTTTVTLFKAMQTNPLLPDTLMEPLLAVADNGLGAVCSQLRVIPLACHHHNILDCKAAIISAINAQLM